MSKRVDKKIEQIRADAIGWLLQQSLDYLKELLDEGWSIEELHKMMRFASNASNELRNVR